MKHRLDNPPSTQHMVNDMGKGFGAFVDEVLRGRDNKLVLNSSIGLAALEIGWPKEITLEGFNGAVETSELPFNIPRMVTNNRQLLDNNHANWADGLMDEPHPFFDLDAENFTLFGLDFPDMWHQLQAGLGLIDDATIDQLKASGQLGAHHPPIYTDQDGNASTIATAIGLPDLPYGELAHFSHIGLALYDTGRTFMDLWQEPALKHNVFKIITHPDMTETLLHRATMLTVMGIMHPLGPLVAIACGYLAAHLVHSAFKLLNHHKDAVQEIASVPILGAIYNASGIKEWAEAKEKNADDGVELDPFEAVTDLPEPHSTPSSPSPRTAITTQQHHGEIAPKELVLAHAHSG